MTVVDVDPHATLAAMRDAAPAHKISVGPFRTAWLITRYEDARRALTDPRLIKQPVLGGRLSGGNPLQGEIQAAMGTHMLNADGADHVRLRRLVSAAFTARRIEALRPRIEEISDGLLDAWDGRDQVDLIDEYAFPLPFQVICELIGVPMVERDSFRAWSNALMTGFASTTGTNNAGAVASIVAYVQKLVACKRAEPDSSLVSGLIQARDAGDRLGENELTSLVFLLLVAGYETTVNLIGNSIYLLFDQPERAERLRRDLTLLPATIEEVLRFESPAKITTMRMATEPVTFGEVTIPAGEVIIISLLSANRDKAAFTDPDLFDPSRQDGQHLAFGHGPHYCLGAPLAKMEGEIAVRSLLTRFPAMWSAVPLPQLPWRPGIMMRGLKHLPVHLR